MKINNYCVVLQTRNYNKILFVSYSDTQKAIAKDLDGNSYALMVEYSNYYNKLMYKCGNKWLLPLTTFLEENKIDVNLYEKMNCNNLKEVQKQINFRCKLFMQPEELNF